MALERTDEDATRTWTRIADGVRLPLLELDQGRFDAAVIAGRDLLRTDPTSPAVDENGIERLADRALKLGDARAAVQIRRLNAAIHPESAGAQVSLSEAYASVGDIDRAIASYEAALAALRGDTKMAPAPRQAIQREATEELQRLRVAPTPSAGRE